MATWTVSSTAELNAALAGATGGDTILCQDGNYSALTINQGFNDYVTIQSVNPGGATFADVDFLGGSYVKFDGVNINNHVTIDYGANHVELSNSSFLGIFIHPTSSHVTLENNDISGGSVTILNASYIDLIGNTIRDVVGNDLLQVIGDSHYITIENNSLLDSISTDPLAHPDLIQFFQDFSTGKTPSDVVIRGNLLYDDPNTGAIGAQGIFISDAGPGGYKNILVEDNMIAAVLANALTIQSGTENVVIQNNTVTAGRIWIVNNQGMGNAGTTVQNNISTTLLNDGGGATVVNNYINWLDGLLPNYIDGGTWQEFIPLEGSPIDLSTGMGAAERLLELIAGVIPNDGTTEANDDVLAVAEDGAVTISADDLLANDTSSDGDPLAITAVTNGAHGSVVVNADGSLTYTPDANFSGQDSFAYTVSDGNGGFDTASVTVNVAPSPDAPVAANDSLFAQADTSTVLNVLANDADPDGDALTITAVTNPANGSVVVNANGTLTYTPTAGFTGTDTFSYTVSDGNGGTDTAQVSVVVDDLPTPILQQGSMSFNGNVASAVILPYDPSHALGQGTLTIAFNADTLPARQGLLTKDASGNGNGHLSVLLEGDDLVVRLQTTTGDFTVTARDAILAGEDYHMALSFGPGGMALYLNGELVDTDAHTGGIAGNQEPIVIGANDWASTTNSANNLQDPFDGTISLVQLYDQRLSGSDIATLAGTDAAPTTTDPTALNDAAKTDEDTPVTIDVLANDSDADGDALTVSSASAANGTVVVNPDNTLAYTPNADFNGGDTITYTVSDGNGGSSSATVAVTVAPVNDAPVANDDTATTNSPVTIDVLANDTDADGDPLSVTAASAPNGDVVINADGTVTYTPHDGFTGVDTLTYTISDGNGGTATATVAVTTPEPGNPGSDHTVIVRVSGDHYDGAPEFRLVVDGQQVGDVHTVASVHSLGEWETVEFTVNAPGGFDEVRIEFLNDYYGGSPDTDRNLHVDWISINGVELAPEEALYDRDGWSDIPGQSNMAYPGALVFDVSDRDDLFGQNGAPVASDDTATTDEDAPVTIDVLANDADADGDALTVTSANAANGTVVVNPDNTLTYTPNADFNGDDTITYSVSDGNGGAGTASVIVTVEPANDAPVAGDDVALTGEDGSVTIDVLANDIDPDGDALTVTAANAANGSVTVNADNTLTYTPNADFNGDDTITYTVSDGNGGTGTASVIVTVEPANDAPVAGDDVALTGEDGSVTIDVLANDTDPDGDALSVVSASAANGSVTVNADNTLTYTPNADFNGDDTITYTVSDGNGGTGTASVIVTVEPASVAPVASDDVALTSEDGSVTIDVLANDTSSDGGPLAITSVSDGAHGTAALNADGSVLYTPDADFNGADAFTYTVSDGNGGFDTASVAVTVTPVNDAPVANDDTATTNSPVTIDVLANDTDADGDPLTVTAASALNGDVVINADGTVTYTPHDGFTGVDTLTYTISDGNGGAATATVAVTTLEDTDIPDPVFNQGSASFTGSLASAIILPHAAAYELGEGTLAIAFNADILTTRQGILTKDASGYGTGGHVAVLLEGNDLIVRLQSATETFVVSAPDAIVAGADYHVALSFGPGGMQLYLNGALVDTDAYTGGLVGNTEPIVIGANDWASSLNSANNLQDPFDGTISSVQIFDQPLTASEIGVISGSDVGPTNAAPTAIDDAATTGEDAPVTIDVLANDADGDGDALAVTSANAANGSVVVNPDNTLTYTPNADFNGDDTITYTVSDGNGGTGSASVIVTVEPANVAPVASDDVALTSEDGSVTIDVLANDTSADGNPLAITSVSDGAHGTAALNADGSVLYTPDADFNGADAFTYTVSDGNGGFDTASVAVTVTPVNEADPWSKTGSGMPVSSSVVTATVAVAEPPLPSEMV